MNMPKYFSGWVKENYTFKEIVSIITDGIEAFHMERYGSDLYSDQYNCKMGEVYQTYKSEIWEIIKWEGLEHWNLGKWNRVMEFENEMVQTAIHEKAISIVFFSHPDVKAIIDDPKEGG